MDLNSMKFGDACWNKQNVAASISNIAMIGDANTPRFLSSHAPINKIFNEKNLTETKDEDLFNELLKLNKNDNLVVIYGPPGSGKSHLINWLKIRFDYALEVEDIKDILPIIIKRKKGSLKDALDQLVQQLPPNYSVYLRKINESVGNISDAVAKQKLANSMHQELGIKWQERNEEYPSNILKGLYKIFISEGFRNWLLRDNGTIDKNIKLLNSESDVVDRDTIPQFEENEFRSITAENKSLKKNTEEVFHLIEEFEEYPETTKIAIDMCNKVLPEAIKDLTGLGGNELSNIFDDIRRELKKENKDLLFLIEDLSTLKALDDEVLEALFPHNEEDVCKLISVVGMTEAGYEKLAENQLGRINLVYSLKDSGGSSWYKQEGDYLNKFVARYLNTIRLDEDSIKKIAEERKQGRDVNISACDKCSIKQDCFNIFNSVKIGESVIGLFPFNEMTIENLLENIVEDRLIKKTQRGILIYILEPILLQFAEELKTHMFDNVNIAVQQIATDKWNGFRTNYLSTPGWEDISKQKFIKFIFDFWIYQDETLVDIFAKIEPLSNFFKLPELSKPVGTTVVKEKPDSPGPNLKPEDPKGPVKPDSLEDFNVLSNRLYEWHINKQTLARPRDIQELVLNFLKESLPFIDNLKPLYINYQNILKQDISLIDIEDTSTKNTSNVKITFERNEENYQLFLSLLRGNYIGKKTWNYENSERDMRVISTWLRKYKEVLFEKIEPIEINTSKPIKIASHLLSICYQIYHQKEISKNNVTAIDELFNFRIESENENNFLTSNIINLKNDMRETVRILKVFLLEQTNVPQGKTGGVNYINPLDIIDGIKISRKSITVETLDEIYFKANWKRNYSIFENYKNTWCNLEKYAEEEINEIEKIINILKNKLVSFGYVETLNHLKTEKDLNVHIKHFFTNIKELVSKLKTNNLYNSDSPIFDKLIDDKNVTSEDLNKEINLAIQIVNERKVQKVLMYNSKKLNDYKFFFELSQEFVKNIDQIVNSRLEEEINFDESSKLYGNIKHTLNEFGQDL